MRQGLFRTRLCLSCCTSVAVCCSVLQCAAVCCSTRPCLTCCTCQDPIPPSQTAALPREIYTNFVLRAHTTQSIVDYTSKGTYINPEVLTKETSLRSNETYKKDLCSLNPPCAALRVSFDVYRSLLTISRDCRLFRGVLLIHIGLF